MVVVILIAMLLVVMVLTLILMPAYKCMLVCACVYLPEAKARAFKGAFSRLVTLFEQLEDTCLVL